MAKRRRHEEATRANWAVSLADDNVDSTCPRCRLLAQELRHQALGNLSAQRDRDIIQESADIDMETMLDAFTIVADDE